MPQRDLDVHPYRENPSFPEPPKPPKSRLPWYLLAAAALHAGLFVAGALAKAPAASAATEIVPTAPITVLAGRVDESTGDVRLSGYRVVSAPASLR